MSAFKSRTGTLLKTVAVDWNDGGGQIKARQPLDRQVKSSSSGGHASSYHVTMLIFSKQSHASSSDDIRAHRGLADQKQLQGEEGLDEGSRG